MVRVVSITFKPKDQKAQSWTRLLAEVNARYGDVLSMDSFEVD